MKKLQKKFNDFKKKIHSKSGIGELYERQIRYIYEKNGWWVKPYGISLKKVALVLNTFL